MNKLLPSLLCASALVWQQAVAQPDQEPAPSVDNVASIETIKEVTPDFPRLAERNGRSGSVVLSYNLDVNGKPVDIKVVDEQPKRLFTSAAVKALEASRFSVMDDQGTAYAVEGLSRRYEFQRSGQ